MARTLALALIACLAAGCAQPWRSRLTLPQQHTLARDQLLIHSDFELPPHHRILEDLRARREDIGAHLGLTLSDEPINVYVFDHAEAFHAFMQAHHPDFPSRRAFFVETDTRLSVYAHWGDRVAEDLRHEVTHAYLHSVLPSIPLWLDEGLAEFYETPRGHQGLNEQHLRWLAQSHPDASWRPDLRRLEQLREPLAMSQADYAECWAWVHFLLRGRIEHAELLRAYVRQLRAEGCAPPLSGRLEYLIRQPEQALVAHVAHLLALHRENAAVE